ncbi:MAG: IclR family transcriptional regulator [Candidatus Velamenicoccus archaeovorus]
MSLAGSSTGGVGVLDRSMAILDAVEAGEGTFTGIVRATGLARPTAHRLLKALEAHGLLTSEDGRGYALGPRLLRLAAAALRERPLRELAHPVLERLARRTGESAQLFVRSGDRRICVDAVEAASELRTIVPVGAALPLTAGSAGKVFLAWASEEDRARLLQRVPRLTEQTPSAERLAREASVVRRRGWATSSGEREPGVASVSAPVLGPRSELVAAVSVSGPRTRVGRSPGRRYAPAVVEAAERIGRLLGHP